MSENNIKDQSIEELYQEAHEYSINTGDIKVHAKRVGGKFRKIKSLANLFWLIFFIGPYLRLGDRQAVLFDIQARQFHIFNTTLLPQDLWMLSFALLFFAILLAVITALAGRVWCGYFCFQTVWTDVFSWIEHKFEGTPAQRKKMDKSKFNFSKIVSRSKIYTLWLIIGFLTGFSFTAWFTDAYQLWADLITYNASTTAYITIATFTVGTFVLAGFLREQACFWLCPYARIQAVMIDNTSIVPSYDVKRGENRGRLVKGKPASPEQGDCIDCKQCIAVCPTGVDIRGGQQEGCIMCGLCIDACDSIMEKINKPKGLIKYASWDGIMGKHELPILKRPRVWLYIVIMLVSVITVGYTLSTMNPLELKVIHSRQPLFVLLSDRRIQNRYTLKILNKLNEDITLSISTIDTDFTHVSLVGAEHKIISKHGTVTPITIFVKIPKKQLKEKVHDIIFSIDGHSSSGKKMHAQRKSIFISKR